MHANQLTAVQNMSGNIVVNGAIPAAPPPPPVAPVAVGLVELLTGDKWKRTISRVIGDEVACHLGSRTATRCCLPNFGEFLLKKINVPCIQAAKHLSHQHVLRPHEPI